MTRGLTRIREDIARADVSELEQGIAAGSRLGWRDHLRHALYLHELRAERDAVLSAFARCIATGLSAYEHAKPPGTMRRTPWDFGQLLGTVASFGDTSEWRRIGGVHRSTFLWPEEPPYVLMADALQVVQSRLRGEADLDGAALVVESSRAENVEREAAEYWGPLAAAVIALANRDASTFATHILTMVRHHERMARHGDLQFDAGGIVALVPLGLVRVARSVNIDCRVDSAYLPIDLL